MKQYRKLLVLMLLLIVSGSVFAQNLFDKAKLDNYFSILEENNKFMGSVAVTKNGEIIYTKTVGFADVENNVKATEKSKYRIGSASKSFTAVLVLKAVEEKKIDLDQTIDKWFPTIANSQKITVRHLLSHRSGIHDFTHNEDYLTWCTQPKTEKEMLGIIENGGSDFEPDSTADYSNSNYVLLTYMLEKVFLKPYSDLLQEYIVEPIGLADTYVFGKTNPNDNECRSYRFLGSWVVENETDCTVPMGAGAIVSTPTDLTKFADALFGGRLVADESLEMMKTIKDEYGLGLFEIPFGDNIGLGHTGAIDGFVSVYSHYADGNVSYALTSNGLNFKLGDIKKAVLGAVYGKPYELPEFYNVASEDLDVYLGEYVSAELGLDIIVTKEGNTLIAQIGDDVFAFEAVDKDKFKYDPIGAAFEFDPEKNTMTLFQYGVELVFQKKKLAHNPVPVRFDECVDLMAMIWRLSGSDEYNRCEVPSYAHEVDSVFAQFKEHPVVQLASLYQQETGITYDAVVSYGLHLTFTESGTIILNDSFLENSDDSFDRWSDQQKKEFLEPLNDFYRTSHFHDWYLKQESLYEQFEDAFNSINQQVDYGWFDNYFGPQSGSTFRIVLSLLVGPNNYGCSAQLKDGSTALSPVIGNCHVDEDGNAHYNANAVFPIVIHEFCHHYCNRLNDQFWPMMSQSAQKVFKEKEGQLRQYVYGTAKTMMDETFVRASVIRYLETHFPQVDASALVKEEEKQGFILTQTLCDALKSYEQQRETYATMSDFMPIYAKAVNDFDLKQYKKQQKQQAKLNATYKVNMKNGAKNVPSGPFLLIIKFSKPMAESIALYLNPGTDFPPVKGYTWSDDTTLEVSFLLEPSHQYGFVVKGSEFPTKDGHNGGKDTEIIFTTGE